MLITKNRLPVYLPASLALVFLTACDIEETPKIETPDYIGVWSAPAYGKIVEYKATKTGYTLSNYHVTSASCIQGDIERYLTNEAVSDTVIISDDKNKLELLDKGQTLTPGIQFNRIDELPDQCVDTLYPIAGDKDYVFNPDRDFQLFWDTLNELYLDFSLSGTDWSEVYTLASAEMVNVTTEDELFSLFSDMITPLADSHNMLVQGDLSQGIDALYKSGNIQHFFSVDNKASYKDLWLEEYRVDNNLQPPLTEKQQSDAELYVEQNENLVNDIIHNYESPESVKVGANESIVWFKTHDDVGYLMLNSMSDYSQTKSDLPGDAVIANKVIDQAMLDLKDTHGLIIDIRTNDGGSDEISMIIASRFVGETTHVYSKQARIGAERSELIDVEISPLGKNQYSKPVILLTSASTISAAETFTISMRNLPNVTVVGEATAGAMSDMLVHRVTSNIAFGISNEFYITPDNEWFEGTGVPVKYEVPFATKTQRLQGRDLGLEKAYELLN